ncbi:MAG: ATP-dependent DNA helicase RecG [Bacteroides sp. SM23_62_1]|nr:MAG: ATP-dependent DNA helicase RecG [Bacteroides sp. SM23_62_1]
MPDLLDNDIQYMQGVGPKRAELLNNELNIKTFGDLLFYFPYKYIDRTKFYRINEIRSNLPYIQVRGQIISLQSIGARHKKRLVAEFTDGTGTIELVWFQGVNWIKDTLKPGVDYIAFGKPSKYGLKINLIHPDLEEASKYEAQLSSSLQAYYSTTEKLKKSYVTSRTIQKLITNLFKNFKIEVRETLPEYLMNKLRLLALNESLRQIHFPTSPDLLSKAQFRLKFEELFYIQLNILKQKFTRENYIDGFVFHKVGDYFNRFYSNKLPFELTGAQKRVIKEIRKDLGSGKQMNRLLQGDVGSGKTLVALMAMLIAMDNEFQACLMAPTEILAMQHYTTITEMTEGLDINVKLLTGSSRKSERDIIHEELTGGTLHILIGTHALIEETVQFNNLGLVIIDEQHRFGVAQRAKLWKKNVQPPHVLVMTATPIPRTLAMTLYGDLDVSVINELPPGRKPIKTIHFTDSKRLRVHGFMKQQITEGRQIFIVYPLIQESEKMDYKDLEDGYFSIKQAFPSPQYAVSIVHGKLKTEDKDFEMERFRSGKTHIMVATTVIEVGVDIPNASVMIIESAERFGLSQLHQLRGRVGRGADQSYCILMTSNRLTDEAKQRIKTMVDTNDGFEIAEVDLKLRGPGDIEGTQQSGMPFELKIANLGRDGQILQYARDTVMDILEDDPLLDDAKNNILKQQLKKLVKGGFNWSEIS